MRTYYSAPQAAARLGVSRQTLYSYVSRGLVRAHPGESHRQRRYLIAEVNQLASRRSHTRSPARATRDALQWGLPVIESSISCIDAGRLYYRGTDVLSLIDSHGVEDVAALLWQCSRQEAFAAEGPVLPKVASRKLQRAGQSLLSSFASSAGDLPADSWPAVMATSVHSCGDLVRILAACVLRASPSAEPLRAQCAKAWGMTAAKARLVEIALILCADHELNASSFTARCVASTAASLQACILGGLASLSGPRHGGVTTRVENFWNEVGDTADPMPSVRARLERGDDLPGFGHPLYPDGDIRAAAILSALPQRGQRWRPLVQAVEQITGLRPSLDFALVALRRQLQLPAGSALGIFSLGRSIGWIAHVLEQRALGTLIRPRAAYVGPRPEVRANL